MPLIVAGSVALDDLATPFGERKNLLGGSAVHAGVSASFFTPVKLVGVVGEDFPREHVDFLKQRKIDIEGLKVIKGKTFHWEGYYEYDMNQAHTVKTDLNVLSQFDPELPESYRKSKYVFLANLDPELQLRILDQVAAPKLVVADTMNYWIENKKDALEEVVRRSDIMLFNDTEAREFTKVPNLIVAAKKILDMGAKNVIIKKGEHGALLFSKDLHFSAPSFPQEDLIDPTGAGDSFAGGLIGYLAKCGGTRTEDLKKAIIIGSVMASFNVEDFSLDSLRKLRNDQITKRYSMFRRFVEFEELPDNYI